MRRVYTFFISPMFTLQFVRARIVSCLISPRIMSNRPITDFFKRGTASSSNSENNSSQKIGKSNGIKVKNGDDKSVKEVSTEKTLSTKRHSSESPSGSPYKKSKDFNNIDTSSYDPSKANYHPIRDSVWSPSSPVPYKALALTLKAIESESSRLKMISILGNFLSSVLLLSPSETTACIYLCSGKVAPDYFGLELGVGDNILIKALAEATGRKVPQIKEEAKKEGDLGLAAEVSRSKQPTVFAPPKLTVQSVYDSMREIALMSGQSSVTKKSDIIKKLIVCSRDCEARYTVRILAGKLRIGLAEQSVLSAVAEAVVMYEEYKERETESVEEKDGEESEDEEERKHKRMNRGSDEFKQKASQYTCLLKEAYVQCPDFEKVMNAILSSGIQSLPLKCSLTPGIPTKPMLAHPSKGIHEVLRRFNDTAFTCEYKYDGERAQIHLTEDGEVSVFSRNQENNTTKYPDIIEAVKEAKLASTSSFIIDSEAVAFDRISKKILPFQVLSTRKRKDVDESDITVRVCIFAFDILYLNGSSLIRQSLRERRKLLQSSFTATEGVFLFAQGRDVQKIEGTTEEIQDLIDSAVKDRCEGLMVKSLDLEASYEIAKRSRNWLKVKKDYLEGVGDSLDLVVLGGYEGKGKRTGVFGGFLLACYDEREEEYQSICKIGTGFKDEDLDSLAKSLKEHIIKEPKSYYKFDDSLSPDVFFSPVQVWEVKCADLSISPVHRAAVGTVDEEKGISLRFPRFIRVREDKKPEDATTSEQVAQMYLNQQSVKDDEDEEDNDE